MLRHVRKLFVICLAVIGTASQAPALDPAGTEFQANTYTSCNQRNPDIAAFPGGGFVIVWASGSYEFPQDGSYPGVFGQRFDDSGTRVGTEFQINTYTTNEQRRTAVAVQPDGRFVVVWHSWGQDGSRYGVVGRQFNGNATPAGTEFLINTTTVYGQYVPRIATYDQGFVVVWESDYQDGEGEGIFGQRFNTNATRAGTEFRINSYTRGHQDYPDVAARSDGNFVVVWLSEPSGYEAPQDGSQAGVFGQRFDSSGAADGTEFAVNTYTSGRQVRPAVAYAPDDSFLVVWESKGFEGTPSNDDDAIGRKFAANGSPAGTEFRINSFTIGPQEDVAITTGAGGNFLVSWESTGGIGATDTVDEGVFARRVSSGGQLIGEEFQVNTYTIENQNDSRVAGLANGGFAVAWESDEQDGTLDGVFGQSYHAPVQLCGDASADGSITATDALFALRTAVGTASCLLCACDVDNSGATTASDALRILQSAVGQPVMLSCAAC